MPAVALGGRPRRRGRTASVAVLVAIAFGWQAAAAEAGLVTVTPRVAGYGTVTGFGPACSNFNQNPGTSVTCAAHTAGNGITFPPTFFTTTLVAAPFGNWSFVGWEGCPTPPSGTTCSMTTAFLLTASPRAVFRDFVGPTVTSITPVLSNSVERGVSFNLGTNEPTSVRECSVDGGAFAPCGTVRQFSEGTHTVRARARDLSSNLGALAAPTTFRVIDTRLISGPADFSSVKRPTFTYSTISGIGFECRLDAAPTFTPCGTKDGQGRASFTPPANLPDGPHTFRVRAVDGPVADPLPITRTWVVDSIPPDTTLDPVTGPPEGALVTLLNASFAFASNEPGTLQCRLDAQPFAPCSSPRTFSSLAFGSHSFQVRSIDRAGNVDPTPASRSWRVVAVDNDGDGFDQRSDCDDTNPRIHPGANEIPNNGVDEDCDGADLVLPPEVLDPPLAHSFKAFARFTKLTRFQVKKVPAGSTVRATCKFKKKCPKKARKAFVKRNASGTVSMKRFTKIKLRLGTRITVRITKPGAIGAVKIFTIRKRKAPKVTERCLPIGATKPVAAC